MAGPWEKYQAARAGQPAGMLQAGNIDLDHRPVVHNPDGSISTVRSISANFDGREVLIPTVSEDGRILSDQEAIDAYRQTGRNLGTFDTPDAATAYAQSLHAAQAQQYAPAAPAPVGPWTRYQKAPAGELDTYLRAAGDIYGATQPSTSAGARPAANDSAFARMISGQPAPASQVAPADEHPIGHALGEIGGRQVLQGAAGLVGAVGGDAINHYLLAPLGLSDGRTYRQAASDYADSVGMRRPETSGERVASDVGEALTGTALTMGGGAAANMLTGTPTRIGQFLTAQPASQVISTAAGSGASSAARESGAGEGTQLLAGLAGSMAPGAAGAATPFVRAQGMIPAAASELTRRALRGRDPSRVREALGDFAAAGTTPSVGQATGNRFAQAAETLAGNVPGGAGRMERFGRGQTQAVSARMDELASGLSPRGQTVTPEQAGRTIVSGIEGPHGFLERFRDQSRALYGELDRAMPRGTRVPATSTAAYLAQQSSPIAGANATSALLANPKLSGIREALQSDLAAGNGVLPYEALTRIRSRVGEMISDAGLVSDIPTRQLRALYGALSEDMRSAAQAAGPQAMKAFTRANNHFKYGMGRLEQVEHVVDKNGGPEKVYAAVFGGINNGATTLRAVMQSLDKPAQRELTASFIRRMGRANSSQQNAAGDVFSMETFLTNWDKVSPEAKRALFDRHGPNFSANMDKIARMAARVREGSRVFYNTSGTARQAALMQTGGTALLAAQQGLTGNVGPAVVTLAASLGSALGANRMARLLTNPKAVSWLASNTDKPVGELLGQLHTLRQVAERDDDPELAELARQLSAAARERRRPAASKVPGSPLLAGQQATR